MNAPTLISIVDDDPSVGKGLSSLLRAAGFESSFHLGADEFLLSLQIHAPDCIITDINMPGIDGFDLVGLLRERGVETPVIMITARREPHLRARASEVGADFLEKPFNAEALLSLIERCLPRRDALD